MSLIYVVRAAPTNYVVVLDLHGSRSAIIVRDWVSTLNALLPPNDLTCQRALCMAIDKFQTVACSLHKRTLLLLLV